MNRLTALFVAGLVLGSCSSDDNEPPRDPLTDEDNTSFADPAGASIDAEQNEETVEVMDDSSARSDEVSAEQMFARLDSDSDGSIDVDEASVNEDVALQFTDTDANGDGLVSREEFLDAYGSDMSPAEEELMEETSFEEDPEN